jgi:hypothetical protein
MRFDAPTFLEPAKLNTIAAELQLNLLRFVAWLAQHFGVLPFAETLRCDLDRRLRRAALATERIIFLHAAWRLRHWKPPAPHHSEGRGSNYRWRRTRAGVVRRLMRIPGLHRGGLFARAQRLAAILAAPEHWIAHRVRHLQRRRHGGFSPAVSRERLAALPAPFTPQPCADTS